MDDSMIQKSIIGILVVVVIASIIWAFSGDGNGSGRQFDLQLQDDDLKIGSEEAPVTIVKYSDLQCPACGSYDGLLMTLLPEYDPSEVHYIYRHFPLRGGAFKYSDIAAQAVEAAAEQGQFSEMKTELFLNQAEWSKVETEEEVRELIREYAEVLELDIEAFESYLDSEEAKAKVERDRQSGLSFGVNATPTFFINGRKVTTNPNSIDAFRELIDSELGKDTVEEEQTEEPTELEQE